MDWSIVEAESQGPVEPPRAAIRSKSDGMNHSTEERDGDAGHGPSNGEATGLRLSIQSIDWTGELDSVLMGRREAGRDELLERICDDQVRRWRRGQRVPAENYLSKFPGLSNDDDAAFELIYGEYLLREER